ncbi:MAG: hypothetical protein GC192_14245 [Bacteroidetes bacterium]|nr:hypothetical protein [Bacteroidota bacterium]
MANYALKLFAALLCLTSSMSKLCAQRVDLDNKSIPVQYVQLPQKPMPADYTTYGTTISVKPDQLRRCSLTESQLQNYLNLPGIQRLKTGGHFHVEVIIDDLVVSKTGIESKTEKSKGENGKEISTTNYWVEVVYAIPVAMKVTDYQGNIVEEASFGSLDKPATYKGKASTNAKSVQDDWSKNRYAIQSKLEREQIQKAFGEIQGRLQSNYAYVPMTKSTTVFQYMDSKKIADFDGFEKAFSTLNESFAKMRFDEPLDAVVSSVQPALDFWNQNKDKYDAGDKQQKKLKFACLYNLTNACFWTEQFDLAEQYANELVGMDYKEGKANDFLENIKAVKADLERCSKPNRHFKAEVSQEIIEAASEVEYQTEKESKLDAQKFDQLKKLGVGDGAEYYEGSITYTDERGTVPCSFFVDYSKNTNLNFLRGSNNIVAIIDNDQGVKRLDIDPTKVDSFTFGDHKFVCIPFAPGSAVSLNKNRQVMEQLYQSDKIALYKFYPVAEAKAGNTEIEVALQRKDSKEPTSLAGLKFLNWKKGLSKYFEDCPSLSKRAADGEFDRSENGALEAAKAFTLECN